MPRISKADSDRIRKGIEEDFDIQRSLTDHQCACMDVTCCKKDGNHEKRKCPFPPTTPIWNGKNVCDRCADYYNDGPKAFKGMGVAR